jgi:gamma-glutamyltranspeptidase
MYAGLFDGDGRLKAVGSHWSRPEYADALQILADEGDEPFYSGRIAKISSRSSKRGADY